MNGKGGKHNPGKENSKGKKKQTKISKDTACSGTDKSTDCLGVNQKRAQREDRSPDLDNQSSHTG